VVVAVFFEKLFSAFWTEDAGVGGNVLDLREIVAVSATRPTAGYCIRGRDDFWGGLEVGLSWW
jgi:hypothetical protein